MSRQAKRANRPSRGKASPKAPARTPGESGMERKRQSSLHPQGPGGVDPSTDTEQATRRQAKQRLRRVLR